MDNLKLSHKNSRVIDTVIARLEDEYGKIDEMMARRGKIHNYLGMRLDFSITCKVMTDMEG